MRKEGVAMTKLIGKIRPRRAWVAAVALIFGLLLSGSSCSSQSTSKTTSPASAPVVETTRGCGNILQCIVKARAENSKTASPWVEDWGGSGWPIPYRARGDRVMILQKILKGCGYEVRIDGLYGEETRATVGAILNTNGMSVSEAQYRQLQAIYNANR